MRTHRRAGQPADSVPDLGFRRGVEAECKPDRSGNVAAALRKKEYLALATAGEYGQGFRTYGRSHV